MFVAGGSGSNLWSYLTLGVLGLAHGYLATIVGAVGATEGKLNPWMVFVSISTVHLAADNLWYFLGHLLGLGGILKYGGRIGLNHQKIDPILPEAQVYASRMLILSKLTSGMAIPVLVTVGVAHVPWRKVIAIATAGEIVRTGSILLLSYRFAVSIRGLGVLDPLCCTSRWVLSAGGKRLLRSQARAPSSSHCRRDPPRWENGRREPEVDSWIMGRKFKTSRRFLREVFSRGGRVRRFKPRRLLLAPATYHRLPRSFVSIVPVIDACNYDGDHILSWFLLTEVGLATNPLGKIHQGSEYRYAFG